MVYRLTLSYRGTRFAGWQRQDNALAVQQVVEEALEDLFGELLRVVAASRTDAGVHARGQSAHVYLPRPFPERGLVHAVNHRLPEDIRLMAAHRMDDGFHSLACAQGKEYRYRVCLAEFTSPLESLFTAPWLYPVDFELLAQATRHIVGHHDFSAFALSGSSHKHPWRRVTAAVWYRRGRQLELRIRGDGFLRGMVRCLVGTLLEVGSGRRSLEDLQRLLGGATRPEAGPTAPAQGLVLQEVFYPPPWNRD
ncbi:MAG: tRNA pseudouridine(38-40) synthase TruA [Acidobacteriota bacterium]|nr:tRNA pseudouridine(38-40) synthase TruA [Acidobacteriota bacterium]